MDLIKERNGFVYGCISLGVACGVGWRGAGGAGDYGCLAVGARARAAAPSGIASRNPNPN